MPRAFHPEKHTVRRINSATDKMYAAELCPNKIRDP